MNIQNTKDVKWVKLKMAIVGQAGAGKTASIKSLLEAELWGIKRKPFIIDAGGGLLTVAGLDIPFATVNTWNPYKFDTDTENKRVYPEDDLDHIIRWLQTEEAEEYNVVVFDMIDMCQQMLQTLCMDRFADDTRYGWGQVFEYCKKLEEACFFKIPHDIIWMCSATSRPDEMLGTNVIMPNLKGQWGTQFMHRPDEVYFAYKDDSGDETKYRWKTSAGPRIQCKSRIRGFTDLLPEVINADFVKLYQIIEQRFTPTKG